MKVGNLSLYLSTYVCMFYTATITEKETMNLRRNKKEDIARVGGKKEKGEMMKLHFNF